MFFEEIALQQLNTITDITDKIYPLRAKKGIEAPYLVYLQNGGNAYRCFDGGTGLKKVMFEFNILHKSYNEMKYLTKTVIDKITELSQSTIGGLEIQDIDMDELVELFEKEVELYRGIVTFKVAYIERI